MSRKHRRLIQRIVMTVLLVPLFLEIGLRIADPWRVGNLYSDIILQTWQVDERRDYILPPGVYQFSDWTVTIRPDETRLVPDTNPNAPCRIGLLGDSVTFANSVSDAEGWPNLVARQFPNVYFINTAEPGYNIDNVLSNRKAFAGLDGYVNVMISNDIDTKPVIRPYSPPPMIYLSLYWQVIHSSVDQSLMGFDEFVSKLELLANDPRVTVVAFDVPFSHRVDKVFPQIQVVPRWTHDKSVADSHASAEGNREITEVILPIVRSAVARACTAII